MQKVCIRFDIIQWTVRSLLMMSTTVMLLTIWFKIIWGAGEIAQHLQVLAFIPEDSGLVASTHLLAHNHL